MTFSPLTTLTALALGWTVTGAVDEFVPPLKPEYIIHNTDSVLNSLLEELESGRRRLDELHIPKGMLFDKSDGTTIVEVRGMDGVTNDEISAEMKGKGYIVTGCFQLVEGACSVKVPLPELRELAESSLVSSVFSNIVHSSTQGVVDSQAVKSMAVDKLRDKLGSTGVGTKIGVMSDSFDACPTTVCATTAVDDIASGDLPDWPRMSPIIDASTGSDEGRFRCRPFYEHFGCCVPLHTYCCTRCPSFQDVP